jgi:hypothetical protein
MRRRRLRSFKRVRLRDRRRIAALCEGEVVAD